MIKPIVPSRLFYIFLFCRLFSRFNNFFLIVLTNSYY
ncbi:unnamed protein product [Arabidopsis halleri]